MRVFNRIFMILLFAGLFVLGVYMVVFAFDLFDYKLESLPIYGLRQSPPGLRRQRGGRQPLRRRRMTLLVLLAILGLIWFVAELRPSAPRRVRMGSGTYVSRSVIQDEVSTVAEQVPDVLGSSVDVKARRSPGAQVDLEARVRRGEDLGTIKSGLQSTVRERLSEKGLPVSKLNVKLVEADPQTDEDEGTVNAFNRLILLILSLLLLAVPVLLLLMSWGFIPADVVDQYTGYRAAVQALGGISDLLADHGGADRDRDRRRARRPDSAAPAAQGAAPSDAGSPGAP